MQRQRLNAFMQQLDIRQRMAKAVCKALFVFIVVCAVLAFWVSLVGCSPLLFPPAYHPHGQSMESWMEQENIWPQGCSKLDRCVIPKLTE